eukprot:363151-Chlamydomonas_euryale.AAC.3
MAFSLRNSSMVRFVSRIAASGAAWALTRLEQLCCLPHLAQRGRLADAPRSLLRCPALLTSQTSARASRPCTSRRAAKVVCSAQAEGVNAKQAVAAAALACVVGLSAVEPAKADIAGLTPCSDSKAFKKREKNEVKKLTGRQKKARMRAPGGHASAACGDSHSAACFPQSPWPGFQQNVACDVFRANFGLGHGSGSYSLKIIRGCFGRGGLQASGQYNSRACQPAMEIKRGGNLPCSSAPEGELIERHVALRAVRGRLRARAGAPSLH